MNRHLSIFILIFLCCQDIIAQQRVTVKWELSDIANLSKTELQGDADNLLTTNYLNGTAIDSVATMTGGNADSGFTNPAYDPSFTQFYVNTRKTEKTSGHNIAMSITVADGHTLKPTKISFDAAKCGTDGGNFDVYFKYGSGSEQALATGVSPLRNKATTGNLNGYSYHEYTLSNILVENGSFVIFLYIYNVNGTDNANPKAIAFRNVVIEGVIDEPIYDASHYVTAASFNTSDGEQVSIYDIVKGLKNGEQASYPTLIYGNPADLSLTLVSGFTYKVDYSDKLATYTIYDSTDQMVFTFKVLFKVSNRTPKGTATPLKRGLMSLNLASSGGSGNLVSWRSRKSDDPNYKFKLFRGTTATSQTTKVNSGNPIMGKTNFVDTSGSASSYYRLEVYDGEGNLVETEVSGKTWDKQTKQIPLAAPPVDTRNGDTYSPHDAAICDMDGDGEYNIILKWYPDNYAKDAASSGTTSNIFFDCYKMDGTFMWRIDMGQNFFASQHTVQFICWDFDGDGYGEFMAKTAPGTVDGEGNFVLLNDDDPYENLKSSRGKQDHGGEYITVFDGMTGAEISTIPYHTDYAAGLSYWGDSNQNRSERYLAAIAWLDGETANPSPIFSRGYYRGAFVGAYDFDGVNLKERWVSRHTQSGKGLWGEGAHWILVGDSDDDGKQEIVYGSAALDDDGSLLYRTGLHHGDALHQGDFITTRPGKEVFMVHEESPYGYDMRDAKTGELLQHVTASSDTGRGLAAHFDHNQKSAQFIYSASAAMFNCEDGSQLAPAWAIGSSGAGINYRMYWDGDLADEFFDKSIIAHWNSDGQWFDRFKVNGNNYTEGTLNDGSKNHPCILADILGDWREEIMTWTKDGSGNFFLVINATNYPTDYIMPHLMDDMDYKAQVIAQNVCYNQPAHLSFDPIEEKTVARTPANIGMTDGFAAKHEDIGDYWDCFYTTYPVELPSGITAWAVTGRDTSLDTLRVTKLAAGSTIPANCGIIYNSKSPQAFFRPSIKTATTVNTTYLKGSYCDSLLESSGTYAYYTFKNGDNGLGLYKVESELAKGRSGFMRVVSTAASPAPDSYRLGDAINPTYVAPIVDIIENGGGIRRAAEPLQYFLPDGRPVVSPDAGTYIVKMSDGTTKKMILRK